MTRSVGVVLKLRVEGDEWKERGRCAEADPEVFFPEKGDNPLAAKSICGRCEVKDACLQWALRTDERFGVWGQTTPNERKALRKRAGIRG